MSTTLIQPAVPLLALPTEAGAELLPVLMFCVDPAAEKLFSCQVNKLSKAAGALAIMRFGTSRTE